jgi:hypothetical protein
MTANDIDRARCAASADRHAAIARRSARTDAPSPYATTDLSSTAPLRADGCAVAVRNDRLVIDRAAPRGRMRHF